MMKQNFLVLLLGLFFSLNAHAVLDITITEGVEKAVPIAIVPFEWAGLPDESPVDMHVTIANDLSRSGRFNTMDPADMPQRPVEFSQVSFNDWRLLGMENIVIGNIRPLAEGNYEVEFRLVNVYSGTQIAGFRIPATRAQLRRTAHRISDIVYEKLTGVRGAFDTRIAYVVVKKLADGNKQYSMQISDADGFNPQILLESKEPLMSPSWSPDGKQLAYVSFEGRNSAIYIQNLFTGTRERVAANPGINSAPAWSPDGTRLAMTLSKEGDPEIFVMHLGSKNLLRVTTNRSIDTEPSWSPDGRMLVFTSDRGGSPQIYQVNAAGGNPERLTFTGNYNTRARYSPDGKALTLVHGTEGRYKIAYMNLVANTMSLVTDARFGDESPSFAPNGSMIIYATQTGRGTELAAVSADGRVHQRLAFQDGEVREPAWGPFPQP
jgi:TolB protein